MSELIVVIKQGCQNSVYNIMLSCWSGDDNERPTFKEIVDMLSALEKTKKGKYD